MSPSVRGGDALGEGAQLLQGELGTPCDPAGQRRCGAFGGMGSRAGEVEQLAYLLHGGRLHTGLAGERCDPFVAGHGLQLSRETTRGRGGR